MTTWRVPPKVTVLASLGALAFAALAVLRSGDLALVVLAAVAAFGCAALAARGLLFPVRLAADEEGVRAGRRRLSWDEVERIRVDVRHRYGLRTELLEIETADHLYMFGRLELGAPPEEVCAELSELRARSRPAA